MPMDIPELLDHFAGCAQSTYATTGVALHGYSTGRDGGVETAWFEATKTALILDGRFTVTDTSSTTMHSLSLTLNDPVGPAGDITRKN
ncbi:hypothetical protein BAJUN_02060 [Bajunvirus bajun]|uniref:Uncharacterized protein n=1 Tax=Brevundimonas phage vB_BgoS-Bajun TaxID=2948594 RepID=A0A9E7N7T4_9CAUD|nr:hypothetical protein BAJUN_02060 [Brevundimonas phage vB_BgoS-Bajun]